MIFVSVACSEERLELLEDLLSGQREELEAGRGEELEAGRGGGGARHTKRSAFPGPEQVKTNRTYKEVLSIRHRLQNKILFLKRDFRGLLDLYFGGTKMSYKVSPAFVK